MSHSRCWLLILVFLSLTGCIATEDKIVDLSGGVFMIFVALVGMKLITPTIINLSIYKSLIAVVQRHLTSIVYPLYFLAISLLLVGFILGGINRVLVFSGFTLAFIAYNITQLSLNTDELKKKTNIEIISLSVSILFVFSLLWGVGSDLFDGF